MRVPRCEATPAGPRRRIRRAPARAAPGSRRRAETPPFLRLSLCSGCPVVGFGLTGAAPGVKGIVHGQAVLEHLMVIREIRRQPERECEQPRGLRRQIEPRGIGRANDDREGVECSIPDLVDSQEGVETAQLAVMRKRLGTGDVVRCRATCRSHVKDPLRRGKKEGGLRVDEAPNEPRAGNPVDLWPLAGDPAPGGDGYFLAKRQAELGPPGDASFEIPGVEPAAAKDGRNLLAYFMAVSTVDGNRAARWEMTRPVAYFLWDATQRRDHHVVVHVESGVSADIEKDRRRCRAERRVQCLSRDRILSLHTAHSSRGELRRAWTGGV